MSVSNYVNDNINSSNLTVTSSINVPNSSIGYSKLNLSNSIVDGDISTSAAILPSKLNGYPSNATLFLNGNGGWTAAGGGGGQTIYNYTVGASGADYTTISAAITAAAGAGCSSSTPYTIYVKAGSYTENLTLIDGINIIGDMEVDWLYLPQTQASNPMYPVQVNGYIEYPSLGSFNGYIRGIQFSTPSGGNNAVIQIKCDATQTANLTLQQCQFNLNSGINYIWYDGANVGLGANISLYVNGCNVYQNPSFTNQNFYLATNQAGNTNPILKLNFSNSTLNFGNSTSQATILGSASSTCYMNFKQCIMTLSFISQTNNFYISCEDCKWSNQYAATQYMYVHNSTQNATNQAYFQNCSFQQLGGSNIGFDFRSQTGVVQINDCQFISNALPANISYNIGVINCNMSLDYLDMVGTALSARVTKNKGQGTNIIQSIFIDGIEGELSTSATGFQTIIQISQSNWAKIGGGYLKADFIGQYTTNGDSVSASLTGGYNSFLGGIALMAPQTTVKTSTNAGQIGAATFQFVTNAVNTIDVQINPGVATATRWFCKLSNMVCNGAP